MDFGWSVSPEKFLKDSFCPIFKNKLAHLPDFPAGLNIVAHRFRILYFSQQNAGNDRPVNRKTRPQFLADHQYELWVPRDPIWFRPPTGQYEPDLPLSRCGRELHPRPMARRAAHRAAFATDHRRYQRPELVAALGPPQTVHFGGCAGRQLRDVHDAELKIGAHGGDVDVDARCGAELVDGAVPGFRGRPFEHSATPDGLLRAVVHGGFWANFGQFDAFHFTDYWDFDGRHVGPARPLERHPELGALPVLYRGDGHFGDRFLDHADDE